MRVMKRSTKAMLVGVITVLAIAPAALAQSVTGNGYGGVAGDVQDQITSVGQADVLPFTGLDLALVAGGGLMLLLVGLVARRRARVES